MKSCAINQEIGSWYLHLSLVHEYLQWRELEYAFVNFNHLKANLVFTICFFYEHHSFLDLRLRHKAAQIHIANRLGTNFAKISSHQSVSVEGAEEVEKDGGTHE